MTLSFTDKAHDSADLRNTFVEDCVCKKCNVRREQLHLKLLQEQNDLLRKAQTPSTSKRGATDPDLSAIRHGG